jgi:beta-lactamase regulating signal transducer with metallopeptidase domain
MAPVSIQSIETLSQFAASALVSSIWQGIVLAAGVGLFLRFLPRTTPAIRFTIWTAAFLILSLLPFFHVYSSPAAHAASAHGALFQADARWGMAIVVVWLALSLVRIVSLATGAYRLHTLWKQATPIAAASTFVSTLSSARLRNAQLCTSTSIERPSVIGFFSPRILIPSWLFDKLTPPELEQIVLHEVGHLRRADDWINLLQKLALVLFPLNPALLWVERRLCFERELACDDAVLRATNAPRAYATCLTSLAEHCLDRRKVSLALGALERKSDLSRRVYSILSRKKAMSRPQAQLVFAVLILALVGEATGLSRCPEFVSFSSNSPMHSTAQTATPSLPLSAPAGYQNVVFHPSTSATPHVTLLKASMPSGPTPQTVRHAAKKKSRSALKSSQPPALQSARGNRPKTQQWVVLTSWSQTSRSQPATPGMVLTVTSEHNFPSRYAAVPTPDGWLVIQL